MNPNDLLLLLICVLVVAILYSSVGHGGGSGYIAALALFSVAPVAFFIGTRMPMRQSGDLRRRWPLS